MRENIRPMAIQSHGDMIALLCCLIRYEKRGPAHKSPFVFILQRNNHVLLNLLRHLHRIQGNA